MSHIARSALIIGFFIIIEKLLGFVRQMLTARQFGLSAELDVFNAANNLPDLIFALISGGALAIVLIPVLSEYLETRGRLQMWALFSKVLNLVFLITAGLSLLIFIFARQIVTSRLGIVPGFDPQEQELVISLMRLNLVATLIFSIAGLVIAGLQANQHFFLPALAKSMYDLGALFGIVILAPQTGYSIGPITLPGFGMGVYGLVYGTLLGALLFLLIQIPGLIHYKFHWSPSVNWRDPGVKKVAALMLPRVGTMFFILMALIYIPDNIASRLTEGSVTALVYGWLFMQVPETLIGTALATALLPTISEKFALNQPDAFRRSINQSLRVILAFTIPSAVLLMIVIPPVIGLLNFDAGGSQMVVWTARAFLLGLAGHAMLDLAARSFYAQQDAITPLWTAFVMVCIFTLLAIGLAMLLDVAGIALANAIAFTSEALLLFYLLRRRYPGVTQMGKTLPRVIFGTIISSLVALTLVKLPLPQFPLAVATLGLGMIVMLPFIWPEIKMLINLE
jgi:putative peptidoglycan lipid II flippase